MFHSLRKLERNRPLESWSAADAASFFVMLCERLEPYCMTYNEPTFSVIENHAMHLALTKRLQTWRIIPNLSTILHLKWIMNSKTDLQELQPFPSNQWIAEAFPNVNHGYALLKPSYSLFLVFFGRSFDKEVYWTVARVSCHRVIATQGHQLLGHLTTGRCFRWPKWCKNHLDWSTYPPNVPPQK